MRKKAGEEKMRLDNFMKIVDARRLERKELRRLRFEGELQRRI
jgi:hypothetical protein